MSNVCVTKKHSLGFLRVFLTAVYTSNEWQRTSLFAVWLQCAIFSWKNGTSLLKVVFYIFFQNQKESNVSLACHHILQIFFRPTCPSVKIRLLFWHRCSHLGWTNMFDNSRNHSLKFIYIYSLYVLNVPFITEVIWVTMCLFSHFLLCLIELNIKNTR